MNKEALAGYKKLAVLIFLFIAVVLFRSFVFDISFVSGNSMNDTFCEGDVLLVKARASDIERYDVVVAKAEGQKIVKRVIAAPCETVYVEAGGVYVNGTKIKNQFDFFTEDAGLANEPYTLGEDEYFLMGDNRNHSYDSRVFGGVNVKNIKGVVLFRIYPFKK